MGGASFAFRLDWAVSRWLGRLSFRRGRDFCGGGRFSLFMLCVCCEQARSGGFCVLCCFCRWFFCVHKLDSPPIFCGGSFVGGENINISVRYEGGRLRIHLSADLIVMSRARAEQGGAEEDAL